MIEWIQSNWQLAQICYRDFVWIVALSSIFCPIWTQFRSKQLYIWPGSWSSQFNGVNSIKSIWSNWLQKWLTCWIFSCLDLNWVQIGPIMANRLNSAIEIAISSIFGPIWTQFRSKQLKIWQGSQLSSLSEKSLNLPYKITWENTIKHQKTAFSFELY